MIKQVIACQLLYKEKNVLLPQRVIALENFSQISAEQVVPNAMIGLMALLSLSSSRNQPSQSIA